MELIFVSQKYYLAIYVCKTVSVDELVNVVATRRRIPRESVVAECKYTS